MCSPPTVPRLGQFWHGLPRASLADFVDRIICRRVIQLSSVYLNRVAMDQIRRSQPPVGPGVGLSAHPLGESLAPVNIDYEYGSDYCSLVLVTLFSPFASAREDGHFCCSSLIRARHLTRCLGFFFFSLSLILWKRLILLWFYLQSSECRSYLTRL